MTFKKNWERSTKLFEIPAAVIEGMVRQAMPYNKLLSYELIHEGCSNLNVRLHIDEPAAPSLILRIYFVNQDGPFMERLSYRLLNNRVPMPCIHYIGKYEEYQFSIAQCMPGISLRDFLLSDHAPREIEKMMFAVGVVLSRIANFQFPCSGNFNRELAFIGGCSQEGYLHFMNLFLEKKFILSHFSSGILLKIEQFTEKNKNLFPTGEETSFVHGDFDANNLLVDPIEGEWKVTGVLDWEMPFSGSIFCDISNMLRYRRQMPSNFENSFLTGLLSQGVKIPTDWAKRADLLNLMALLSCLAKTNPEKSPQQCADICKLVGEIVES
ncbi:MAG: aminoglycoside phosphotransferase family protein [Verrucomicrobiota bacterium]